MIVKHGDITEMNVDAVVNAANFEGCATGEAVITGAESLPAKFVIHTVGPVWNGGINNEKELLANCYSNSLKLAQENNVKTIAFPNISTGSYGFPKLSAAEIAINSARNLLQHNSSIEKIIFTCFDKENYDIYRLLLKFD
jgi:O-acetyl-ADP-ribose deacetylase